MYNSSIEYMYMYIQFLEGIKSLVIKKGTVCYIYRFSICFSVTSQHHSLCQMRSMLPLITQISARYNSCYWSGNCLIVHICRFKNVSMFTEYHLKKTSRICVFLNNMLVKEKILQKIVPYASICLSYRYMYMYMQIDR